VNGVFSPAAAPIFACLPPPFAGEAEGCPLLFISLHRAGGKARVARAMQHVEGSVLEGRAGRGTNWISPAKGKGHSAPVAATCEGTLAPPVSVLGSSQLVFTQPQPHSLVPAHAAPLVSSKSTFLSHLFPDLNPFLPPWHCQRQRVPQLRLTLDLASSRRKLSSQFIIMPVNQLIFGQQIFRKSTLSSRRQTPRLERSGRLGGQGWSPEPRAS